MFHHRPLQEVSPSLVLRPGSERSPSKFCENGRAYITDPNTGQPVCLCQLETHPAHSLQAHPALRGLRSHPATRPAFGDMHNYQVQLPNLTTLSDHTNGLLSSHLAFHPYGPRYPGMDLNGGPIRKAATRETTGPLKIWLSEHKKNPYPTKAEKIMLAIITRMTLTQVSTWFANARRRLKKDNGLSLGGSEEDNMGVDSDREGDLDSVPISVSADEVRDVKATPRTDAPRPGESEPDSFSDISEDENDVFRPESRDTSKSTTTSSLPVITSRSEIHQSETFTQKPESSLDSPDITHSEKPKIKPKIWSISHILDS